MARSSGRIVQGPHWRLVGWVQVPVTMPGGFFDKRDRRDEMSEGRATRKAITRSGSPATPGRCEGRHIARPAANMDIVRFRVFGGHAAYRRRIRDGAARKKRAAVREALFRRD